MMYSKLLLAELRKHNACRVVVAKQPAESLTPILSLTALHSQGVHIPETNWPYLKLEGECLPSHACVHLFSVEEELKRVPRGNSLSIVSWGSIQRAVYARGRRTQPAEILTALWHSRHLFGDRLIIFSLHDSFRCEERLCSFLAWRPVAECGYGELRLVPRTYWFGADTWIGYCER